MEFTFKNQDATSALLSVTIQEADYSALVEKQLKNIRQKANIPGFRPGMVPMGLVKKQYGTAVKAEEINKLLQTKIFEYIKENKIDMLGEPLPSEEQQAAIDMVNDKEFTFEFEIALAPKFDASLSASDKLAYYKIQPTAEMIDSQVQAYAQRCGEYKQVEVFEGNDMLKGSLVEAAEGGINVREAVMMPAYMKNDDQKALFAGSKVGDVITFNPTTAFDGSEAELASLLKVEKNEVAAHATLQAKSTRMCSTQHSARMLLRARRSSVQKSPSSLPSVSQLTATTNFCSTHANTSPSVSVKWSSPRLSCVALWSLTSPRVLSL